MLEGGDHLVSEYTETELAVASGHGNVLATGYKELVRLDRLLVQSLILVSQNTVLSIQILLYQLYRNKVNAQFEVFRFASQILGDSWGNFRGCLDFKVICCVLG